MRHGVPIAFGQGVKVIRSTKIVVPAAVIKTAGAGREQKQSRQIICRFLRETVFTKRVSVALGAAVSMLVMMVQPLTTSAAGVKLNWDPGTATGLVGYNVYYGVASGNYTSKAFVGNVTNTAVTGLVPGATYYFSATSVGAAGAESAYSTEISYTVPTVSATPNGGLRLNWDPNTATNVVGYNVYYGVASGNYTNKTFVGNVTNAIITGLVPGTTYYLSATSVSASGAESAHSAEITYTVPNPVVLAMNTIRVAGKASGISLTATGNIPTQWTIQSSTDLQTWTPLVSGTNSAVSVTLAISSLPKQFFRLVNE